MSPVFATRRRAEQFHRLVEGTTPAAAPDPSTPTAELLDVVGRLRAVEPVDPRPEFSASLRAELMAAADTLLVPSEDARRLSLPPRSTRRDRRVAALVGAAAIVGASTSLAVAAQSALPGEALYPLKRVLEDAEAGAQLSEQARGVSLLDSAAGRLSEVTALLRTGDLDETSAVADTLDDFSEQSQLASRVLLDDYAETGDDDTVVRLRDFTARSMQTLASLQAMLPDEATDELQQAAEVLAQIDAAAARACPSCDGGITQVPRVLLSSARAAERDGLDVVPAPVVGPDPAPGRGPAGGDVGAGTDQQPGPAGPVGGGGGGQDDLLPPEVGTGGGGGGADDEGILDDLVDPITGGGTASQGGGSGGGGDGGGGGGGGSGGGGTTGTDPLDDVLEGVDDTVTDLTD